MSDPGKYRSVAEVELWKERDPLPNFAARLMAEEIATEENLACLRAKATAVVAEAVRFAEESPWPEDGEVFTDVLASNGEELCPWLK
jgi:pyruvate dehydrogenase E1 component alpha subunit